MHALLRATKGSKDSVENASEDETILPSFRNARRMYARRSVCHICGKMAGRADERTALLIARNRRSFFRQTKRRMLPTPRVTAAKRRWLDHRFRVEKIKE